MPVRFKTEYQDEFQSKKPYFAGKHLAAGLKSEKVNTWVNPRFLNKQRKPASDKASDDARNQDGSKDEDTALKHKAHVARPSSKQKGLKSEYQLRYDWKNPIPRESPLIAADRGFFGRKRNITGAADGDAFPRMSEYKSQFVEPRLPRKPSTPADEKDGVELKPFFSEERAESEHGPPTPVPDLPVQEAALQERPRPVLSPVESLDEEPSLCKKKKRYKRYRSTYESHYKSPVKYRAKRAGKQKKRKIDPFTSWFDQVVELRACAREYEYRSRGTFFSRDHLAQLEADQCSLWDRVSTSLETMSISSIASKERPPERKGYRPPPRNVTMPSPPPSIPSVDDNQDLEDVESSGSDAPRQRNVPPVNDPLIGFSTGGNITPRHSFQSRTVPVIPSTSPVFRRKRIPGRGLIPETPYVDPLIGQHPSDSDARHMYQSPHVPVLQERLRRNLGPPPEPWFPGQKRRPKCTCRADGGKGRPHVVTDVHPLASSPDPSEVLERVKQRQDFWDS
eukprot:m.14572 g.14572  ORF g.14572 m.14572 type:complete len:507 (+) comp25825_c0_seq2:64-1584(+)